MNGKALLESFSLNPLSEDFVVHDLCNNSQRLTPGDLFFAYPGDQHDGRQYLLEALKKNPAALVCESQGFEHFKPHQTHTPIILVQDLKEKISHIAGRFYGDPSKTIKVTGITGTNGKTTVSHLLYQAWQGLGLSAGCMGTLGVKGGGMQEHTGLTTPDALHLQKYLKRFKDLGVSHVAMEVSSHALMQDRTKGITFDTAVYTNLTPEHLDYHQTMNAYSKAKQRLFRQRGLKRAVINAEDAYAVSMLSQLHPDVVPCLFTTQHTLKGSYFKPFLPVTVSQFEQSSKGLLATVATPWGEGVLNSKLIGSFNLSNLLAVLSVLCQQGADFQEVLRVLPKLNPPQGRMQRFGGARMPQVIVDYAHTPDALRNALKVARQTCKRKLWCVFGCGGNRDESKRELMGAIASEFADTVVLTNDNPRLEPPEGIIQDILKGMDAKTKVHVEPCRKSAIAYALSHALSFDVILIAGKGHEDYQIVGDERIDYSDIDYVKQLLSEYAL